MQWSAWARGGNSPCAAAAAARAMTRAISFLRMTCVSRLQGSQRMAQGSSQQKQPLLGQQTSKLQGSSSVVAKDVRAPMTEARASESINNFFFIFVSSTRWVFRRSDPHGLQRILLHWIGVERSDRGDRTSQLFRPPGRPRASPTEDYGQKQGCLQQMMQNPSGQHHLGQAASAGRWSKSPSSAVAARVSARNRSFFFVIVEVSGI